MQLNLPLLLVHFNIVIYAFCYWLQEPVQPFLTAELGADTVTFGWLRTAMSLSMLFGSPLFGRISDTYGSKTALQAAQLGSAATYFLSGIASNVPMLFVSRIPTFFQQAMQSAQAFITVMTEEEHRAQALGRLTLSYAIGMVLGSPLGGFLSEYIGYSRVFLVAAALSVGISVLNAFFLPTGRAGSDKAKAVEMENKTDDPEEEKLEGLGMQEVIRLMKLPSIRQIVIFQLLIGTGLSMYRTVSSIVLKDNYELEPSEVGFLTTLGAVAGFVANNLLMGPLVSKFSEFTCLIGAGSVVGSCLLFYSTIPSYTYLLAHLIPLSMAMSVIYTLGTSAISKASDSDSNAGTAIGLAHATRTFCGVISPTLAGYVYQYGGQPLIGVFSAAFVGLSVVWNIFTLPTNIKKA